MTTAPARHWKDLLSRQYETAGTPLPTHFVSQRLGACLAAVAFQLGLSPNALTLFGFALILLGCGFFALSVPLAWFAAAVVWQFAFAFDCADGQLARATRRTSKFGAWLDLACDHVREVAISFTVLYIAIQSGLPLLPALFGCVFLASGNLIFLQTASTLRTDDFQTLRLASAKAVLRLILRNALDLPVFLLIVCLLRGYPEILLIYVCLHGLGQGLRAVSLGYGRIRTQAEH